MRSACLAPCLAITTLLAAAGAESESPSVSASGKAALDAVLSAAVDAGDVPGVVAVVVDRDSTLYRGAFGVMDAAGEESMRLDAIFRIASMTKPITSVGIMMLREQGLLALDDPASDYLPELAGREVLVSVDTAASTVLTRPASSPITIRDLLRHTSGIAYGFSSHEAREVSRHTVASASRVGGILEAQPNGDVYSPTIRGDGGLLSTADDYSRFLQLMLGRGERNGVRLLNEQSVAEMVRDQLEGIVVVEQPSASPNTAMAFPLGAGRDGFGLGFQVAAGEGTGGRSPGSLSWGGIANTHFWIDLENDLGVVLMMQFLPFYDDKAISLLTTFERTLYRERAR